MRAELSADVEQQMLEQIRFPSPTRSFVDYKFANLPPAEAWTQAHCNLKLACGEFTNHVFTLFDTLQQKKIVGQIQETSSTCRFTYFRRVVVAEFAGTKNTQRVDHDTPANDLGAHGVIVETVQLTDFTIQHRLARHVHHVRNPTLNEPDSTVHPLPTKYSVLIEACPEWMSGSLRVLEGELFRDERTEWDFFTETRTDEKVIERVRRDPAVVFGPYILAGWGELAIAEEERRQRDEQNDAAKKVSARKSQQNHWLSFIVAGLAIAVIPFTVWATAVTTSLAILLGLVAMLLSGNATHLALFARGNLSASPVLLHSTLVGATVFSVQAAIFSLLHWSLPALGIAVIAVTIAAIAYRVKTVNTDLDK